MRSEIEQELAGVANSIRAGNVARFFKTGKGQYGEGDQFLGITVPAQRKIALRYRELPLEQIAQLLESPIHEHRFVALEILVAQYEHKGREQELVEFYLAHTAGINNWDLVDTSAPYILGDYVKSRSRKVLDKLAASKNMWERRIAIVATLALIKGGEIDDTFRIARKLLGDSHDLIHKAVGWALRETGKISRPELLRFVRENYAQMPRTALRYAIEHLSVEERKRILLDTPRTGCTDK